jgi:hypothetical protein
MIGKDSISILRERRTKSFSIIFMNTEYPLTEKQQNRLDKLAKISDTFLVFDDKWGKGSETVDKMKFTCLHDCYGWVDVGNSLGETILKVLEYTLIIPESSGHLFYSFVKCDRLGELTTEITNTWVDYKKSNTLVDPVFKLDRLSPSELANIYRKLEPTTSTKPISKVDLIKKWIIKLKYEPIKKSSIDYTNAYTTHHTKSWFVPMKVGTISRLVDFYKENKNLSYIRTFEFVDPFYFIASLIVKLGITISNFDFTEVEIKENNIIKKG